MLFSLAACKMIYLERRMRETLNLKVFGFCASVIATLACCSTAKADTFSEVSPGVSFYGDPGVPDISGLWLGTSMGIPEKGGAETNSGRTTDGRPPIYWSPWPLPYRPEYKKIYEDRVAAKRQGVAIGDIGSRCLPFGMPMMLDLEPFPEEVIQTPGQVMIFIFATFPISIWTDGRPHPKDLTPSYNGHSIGYWAGDTLFVDTQGIRPETTIDASLNPHSAKLRLKWTVQRVTNDIFHVHLTLFDDEAFTEPVSITNNWHRKSFPEWQMLDDQSCFEKNAPPPPAASGFVKF